MRPFLYWFDYIDNYTTTHWNIDGAFEQQDNHVLRCVLLADSTEDALSWGNHLAEDYLKSDEVHSINPGWLEEVVPEVVSELPHAPTDWTAISKVISQISPAPPYFVASANGSAQPMESTLHALIYANAEQDAIETWENFLKKNYPHLQSESISLWDIPIAQVGEDVKWE